MVTMPEFLNKKPTHGVRFVNGQPTVIFDTICTKNKTPWLASVNIHQQLVEIWQNADPWLVGRYVIMPDHIHFFAWATEQAIEYENWVRYWKSQFTKQHQVPDHRWQTDHWDTRLRNESVYEEKWNYVKQNPERAQLTTNNQPWPYEGEVFELRWP